MANLVINGQPQSPYVRTARMGCIEAGAEHDLRPLTEGSIADIFAALRTDSYRKKHPFARMPSLEDGDDVVFETSAICRYVSEKYGGGCLVPADSREAIRMEQWISAINCYVIPDTGKKFIGPFVFQDEPDLEAIERDKPALRAHYEIIDRALDGRTVLAGDSVSIADALERIARDPAAARAMGLRGRERVLADFDLETNARHLAARIGSGLTRGAEQQIAAASLRDS